MTKKFGLGLSALILAALATAPAGAQRKSHGAGVSWSGTHGGVSWDGGHAYEGGGYGGYPAASPPRPAYKMPQPPSYLPQLPRSPDYQRDSSARTLQHNDRAQSLGGRNSER